MTLIKVNNRSSEDTAIHGRRNLLHNGAMQVAQRGTSFAETTAASYTLDRWLRAVGSSFNFDTTITQSTDVPSGEGFKYSLKVECDTVQTPSGSHNAGIGQRLEGQDFQHLCYGTSSAKSIVLTFWTKSNKTGTYCVQFATNHGNSTASYRYSFIREYTINTANTWEKKTLTVPGLTTQDIETTDTEGFRVKWWLAVGGDDTTTADAWEQSASYLATSNQVNFMDNTSNEWYLTGCQLEEGTVSSPYEYRSYMDELRQCQRYYFTSYDNVSAGTTGTNTTSLYWVKDGTNSYATFGTTTFPSQMRVAPSATVYNATTGNSNSATSDGSNFTAQVYFARKHTMAGGHANVSVGNATGIHYHMTATAEL